MRSRSPTPTAVEASGCGRDAGRGVVGCVGDTAVEVVGEVAQSDAAVASEHRAVHERQGVDVKFGEVTNDRRAAGVQRVRRKTVLCLDGWTDDVG